MTASPIGKAPNPDELAQILALHKKWLYGQDGGVRAVLTGAVLTRADLTDAVLTDAVLTDADLTRADLTGADLTDAVLTGAVLTDAVLTDAVLTDAVLTDAVLTRADLTDAVLTDAVLTGAVMTDGVRWEEYLTDVVPALLTAGGKELAAVTTAETWNCHSWDNCPIAVAFDVDQLNKVPALYRAHARQFVKLFDARLIPRPVAP